jgi:alpha-tubulin suppressor-like RCC1 family protein
VVGFVGVACQGHWVARAPSAAPVASGAPSAVSALRVNEPAAAEQPVRAIAVGLWSSCALLDDATVWCWGEGHTGASGNWRFRQIPLRGVTELWGGGERFVALTPQGLFFWGKQALDGRLVSATQPYALPAADVQHAALTDTDLCALERGGRVRCWNDATRATPVTIPDARTIALSTDMRCALRENGRVSCWVSSKTPVERPELSEIVELVGAGSVHCARSRTGAVKCWSRKGDEPAVAAQLAGNELHLSATPNALCALDVHGAARCVSVDSGSSRDEPVAATTEMFEKGTAFGAVAYGPQHACALVRGAVWCWAKDSGFGMLGNAQDLPDGPHLVRVTLGDTAALRRVSSVALSDHHHCVALTDGTLRCWGENQSGELGLPRGTNAFGPTLVPGMRDVARVVASGDTTCVLKRDASLHCFGGMKLDAVGALQVGLGNDHGCWLQTSGQVRCWGKNEAGQLGSGDTEPHAEPVLVSTRAGLALGDVKELRVFSEHTCAVTSSQRLYCWGSNSPFEQGRAYASAASLPFATDLGIPEGVRDVSDRCLLTAGSELRCWGDISPNTRRFSYTPLRIGRCSVEAIATGPGTCFADSHAWACLGPDYLSSLDKDQTLSLAVAKLGSLVGVGAELCGIESTGELACFGIDYDGARPSFGTLGATLGTTAPPSSACTVDAVPPVLPQFPPLPAARVTAQPSQSIFDSSLSTTVAEVQLSPLQIQRLLALLNDARNYTNMATCHDATYYYLFHDQAGAITARVGVGDCFTLESEPEIPAQHGRGNVIEAKLGHGLQKICRELGLAVCKGP